MIPNRSAARCAVPLLGLLAAGCWSLQSTPPECLGSRDERSCVRAGQARAKVAPAPRVGVPSADRNSGSSQAGTSATGTGGAGTGSLAGAVAMAPEPEPAVAGPRSVLVGAVVNARDLGGIPLAGDAAVVEGVLFRGPPLANLSEAGCGQLAELEVHTVIDLRQEPERASKPTAQCAEEQTESVLAPLPIPYSVSPTDYLVDLNTSESMMEVFRTLGDPDAYPVYFHCTWGRDRTAVVAAVILLALGADRDAIMDDYLLSQATVGAYPKSLEAVLDEVEAGGGIDAFLASSGIDEAWVATLRATAVASP